MKHTKPPAAGLLRHNQQCCDLWNHPPPDEKSGSNLQQLIGKTHHSSSAAPDSSRPPGCGASYFRHIQEVSFHQHTSHFVSGWHKSVAELNSSNSNNSRESVGEASSWSEPPNDCTLLLISIWLRMGDRGMFPWSWWSGGGGEWLHGQFKCLGQAQLLSSAVWVKAGCVCVGVSMCVWVWIDLRGPSNSVGSTLRCSQTNSPLLLLNNLIRQIGDILNWFVNWVEMERDRGTEGQRDRDGVWSPPVTFAIAWNQAAKQLWWSAPAEASCPSEAAVRDLTYHHSQMSWKCPHGRPHPASKELPFVGYLSPTCA